MEVFHRRKGLPAHADSDDLFVKARAELGKEISGDLSAIRLHSTVRSVRLYNLHLCIFKQTLLSKATYIFVSCQFTKPLEILLGVKSKIASYSVGSLTATTLPQPNWLRIPMASLTLRYLMVPNESTSPHIHFSLAFKSSGRRG